MRIGAKISIAAGLGLASVALATPAFAANDDWYAPAPAFRHEICADPEMRGYFQKWVSGPANNGETYDYTGATEREWDPAAMRLFVWVKNPTRNYLFTVNCLVD